MKKILAFLLSLVLLCGCAAMAEDLAAEFETEFSFDNDLDMVYVTSFEEAAAYYAGEIPAFTAPEGFYLDEILVDDFGLTAYYTSIDPAAEAEAEDEETEALTFEFSMYDYGKEEGVSHYSMAGGVLSDATAAMVSIYEEDDLPYCADVHTTKGDIYFFFDGLDRAQVEAVLAGLAI